MSLRFGPETVEVEDEPSAPGGSFEATEDMPIPGRSTAPVLDPG